MKHVPTFALDNTLTMSLFRVSLVCKKQPYKPCTNNAFCMQLTPAELSALPTLTIKMEGGVEINVRPEAYMDPLGKENSYAPRYCSDHNASLP